MALDVRLTQRLTTQLTLTPQLKLSIDILQLPLLELAARIQQELAENPVLEELDSVKQEPVLESPAPESETDSPELSHEQNAKDSELSSLQEDWQDSFQNSLNERPEDLQARMNYLETLITRPTTLSEYLLQQICLLELTDPQRSIAETVIGNMDDNGYLKASLEEMAKDCRTTLKEISYILEIIQNLEPTGVGARNLTESLLIQLKKKPESSQRKIAERILTEQIMALEHRQYGKIARALELTHTEVTDACNLISTLEPKPGRRFNSEQAVTVIPDLIVKDKDGEMVLTTRDEGLPRLRINRQYRQMLKDPNIDKATKDFIRQKVQMASGFIRAIDQRCGTLQRIAKELISTQKLFLEKGIEHLKPLRLKDIALVTGLHESTISRTVQNKYMETPNGVIPLRKFFSGALLLQNGEARSQASIKDRIQRLIDEENSRSPLSDARITAILSNKDGLKIARRTVAKYREEMKIRPTHQRRVRSH